MLNSELNFTVGSFDGPLDLLLKLIARHKIDIYDIPIAFIFEQYTAQIEQMRENQMEIAAEFITMAAELMLIKSRMLLPKAIVEQEGDPRAELARTLAEYKRAKDAAEQMAVLYGEFGRRMIKETDEIGVDNRFVSPQNLDALIAAFGKVLLRRKVAEDARSDAAEGNLREILRRPITPIPMMATGILRRLIKRKRCRFDSLFDGCQCKSDIVASFMAVLQLLAKRQITLIFDDDALSFEVNYNRKNETAASVQAEQNIAFSEVN